MPMRTVSFFAALAPFVAALLPAQEPKSPAIRGRLVDPAGQPLAEGSEVQARVTWHGNPPSGIEPALEPLVVGPGGSFEIPPRWASPGPDPDPRSGHWLHIEHRDREFRRSRVFVPMPAVAGTFTLQPEECLASGSFADETGAALSPWMARIEVLPRAELVGPGVRALLDPRIEYGPGSFQVFGWRGEGSFQLRAFYLYHGPSSPDLPFEFGANDLELTLPATGHLQVRLDCPKLFPERAAFAVMRDPTSGVEVQRHFLIPRDATNIRLRTGRHAVTCELNGVTVADYGVVEIAHEKTHEVALDLSQVRVFVIEVVDTDGRPIPAARVRAVGSPDEPLARQPVRVGDAQRHAFVVATTKESVDLEVSEFGYETRIEREVRGERVLVLEKKPR